MTPKLTGSRSSVQSLITGGCVLSRPRWCSLFFNLRMICQVCCTVSHNTQSLIMSCNGNTECEHVHEVTEGVNYLKSRQAVCWGGWGGVSWQGNILCHVTDLHAKHGNNHNSRGPSHSSSRNRKWCPARHLHSKVSSLVRHHENGYRIMKSN